MHQSQFEQPAVKTLQNTDPVSAHLKSFFFLFLIHHSIPFIYSKLFELAFEPNRHKMLKVKVKFRAPFWSGIFV